MENSIKQKRVSFSSSGQERANVEQSFKGENKGQNWFFRQFNSQTSHNNNDSSNMIDSDFATAIAATTFAIHSQYQRNQRGEINRLTDTRKQAPFTPPELASGGVSRRYSIKENQETGEGARKSLVQNVRVPPSLARRRSIETEADVWEKNEMAKIKRRYEKMSSKILQWENEKKTRAKRHMERKKSEMEQIRVAIGQHYKAKIVRINHIAGGAKAQAEENRKIEESKVKERAKKIRSTGKIPAYCFCF